MASFKRKADELAQGEEQEGNEMKSEHALENNLTTYLRRHVNGDLKTSGEDMYIYKMCQGVYKDMGPADKLEFAYAFDAIKKCGTIPAWMKAYVDQVMIKKAKYMTRSFPI
jgi:hypothetical protein